MNVPIKEKNASYKLRPNGEFVIQNYNFAKPFASFFPGIAGKYGIPMWVFYVNRGQAIASFGIKDKDHSILEFFPANKSWQFTPFRGFRTFLKVYASKKTLFYEPFHNGFSNIGFELTNSMSITPYEINITERNLSLGLEVNVEYFTIPHDTYAALARIVTITNTGKNTKKMQFLDGLPQIVPYGTTNLFLKKLGRTIEAWMKVKNLENGVPYYKLDVDPTDRPEVFHIAKGNFFLGFCYEGKKTKIIKPIVDPRAVFGSNTDFSCPYPFLGKPDFRYPADQATQNQTPSGFLLSDVELSAGESKTFYILVGYMRSLDLLCASLERITAPGYLGEKRNQNKELITALQQDIDTKSNLLAFDFYVKQTYIDNIMRGGYPLLFKCEDEYSVFYLYSRKHGDLERDYNKFQLQPTYFSQGNGNYRDINQNRRCDIWFNPQIKDANVLTFFNLLQADGYNPLVVKGLSYSLKKVHRLEATLKDLLVNTSDMPKLLSFLSAPFTPGEVIFFIEENQIQLTVSHDEFLATLMCLSEVHHEAEHGEGFWIDHWTYNLDLLENYLNVYPEKLREIFFEKKTFTFFDNSEIVKPRHEKYLLRDGKVKQIHAITADSAKKELIRKRAWHPHLVRTQNGHGDIYRTTLINKMLCLLANKLATLDPFGVGIEMEADKPNWFDALNGLPALFGSSTCETMELKRLCLILNDAFQKTGLASIEINEEIYHFLYELNKLLKGYSDFEYWDRSACLKEEYRAKVKLGFTGKEKQISTPEIMGILDNALAKLDSAIKRSYDKKTGVYYAYFMHEVVDYEMAKEPFVRPRKFNQKPLPFFLETQVHALRLAESPSAAKALYQSTRKTGLYDKKLKMYKVTASLQEMPEEIGRCRVFTPGWLENESIWLHMEYKYLLEILRCGLQEEFYADFENALIPFQDPQQYGRNTLENSSFLVSSVFADSRLHGNGFVARLSGSTAEFLNIWLLMNLGKNPFTVNPAGELIFTFSPILPGWLFTKKDKTYDFTLFSRVKVLYHNPKRQNTYGKNAVTPKRTLFKDKDGNSVDIASGILPAPYAEQLRDCLIKRIDVYLDK